jgi:CPA2 family monovalent cation:H+ antiporter-2
MVLNTAVATMGLTPAISGTTSWIYARVGRRRGSEILEVINLPSSGLADHVVVAGAGQLGRSISDALSQLALPCVLIELDHRRVEQARAAGVPIIYGDASQPVVLEAAGIVRARALLVTLPAYADVRAIIVTAQQLQPDVTIVARADGPEAVQGLHALGIDEVTSPEFEAAIEMTRQALFHLDVPAHEVLRIAAAMRRERYGGSPSPS